MVYRERVASLWDDHVRVWMSGHDPLPDPLLRWFGSYAGKGRGAVTRDGFAEPYQGDLLGKTHPPRLVVLGVHPGGFVPAMQARDGVFVREIQHEYSGDYSEWAASDPYARDAWTSRYGRNNYVADRIIFTGRWLGIADPVPNDLMVFELYPWHSTGVTGRMPPPPDVIDEFLWQPISEIDSEFVFGFGRDWDAAASSLGLPCVRALGVGGEDYGSQVRSRAVRLYTLPSGQRLVVEWHSGSAKPPSAIEVDLLRGAIGP